METAALSFWNLLEDQKIEIPIIQRDYAQGRDGKEELRKSFLRDLKSAIGSNEPIKLDFVYGTKEDGALVPLDGQQRLTTLWLLHWFIAYRAQKLDERTIARLRKFTYETRASSRKFCEQLVGFTTQPPAGIDIGKHIQNQRWFRKAWRNDPTIQSMLRMLSGSHGDKSDGIEKVFSYCDDDCLECRQCINDYYWGRLTSPDCPIVFYHLNLPGIAHSDDLYIKMNARGKPLSSFENFKADLAGYIEKQKDTFNECDELLNPRSGLPIMMDTKWTQLFWRNKSPDYNTIDEIYFAFLNRFFFSEVCLAKIDGDKWLVPTEDENSYASYRYLNDSRNGGDYDLKIAYSSFDPYKFYNGEIPLDILQRLKKTLDAFCGFIGDKLKPHEVLPRCEWDNEFRFIPEYSFDNSSLKDNSGNEIRKITSLTQPQRVVFFSICKFFWEMPETISAKEKEMRLKRWLRVVWNLVSVLDVDGKPVIRTFGLMRSAMNFIKGLDSQNVYNCLGNMTVNGDSAFDLQCKEEVEKSRRIIVGDNVWEQKIIDAENFTFFQGSIRFLFQNAEGKVDWNDFDTKLASAKRYFDNEGIKNGFKVLLTKCLVLQCNSWENQLRDKQIFNPNKSTWHWILCAKNWEAPIHRILMCNDLTTLAAAERLDNEDANNYVKPILESLPYAEIIKSEPRGRIRWNGRWAFYRPNAHYAMFTFDGEEFKRNNLLQGLIQYDDFELQAQYIIHGTVQFFKGWDVRFKYKEHCFQWGVDNNIYLLDQDWNLLKREIGGKSDNDIPKSSAADELCLFCAKGMDSPKKIIDGLQGLIDGLQGLITGIE